MAQFGTWALGRLTTKQDLEKVTPTIEALAGAAASDVLSELPRLEPGQFVLLSPDHLERPTGLQSRWLYSQHQTLDESKIAALCDERWRERFAGSQIVGEAKASKAAAKKASKKAASTPAEPEPEDADASDEAETEAPAKKKASKKAAKKATAKKASKKATAKKASRETLAYEPEPEPTAASSPYPEIERLLDQLPSPCKRGRSLREAFLHDTCCPRAVSALRVAHRGADLISGPWPCRVRCKLAWSRQRTL